MTVSFGIPGRLIGRRVSREECNAGLRPVALRRIRAGNIIGECQRHTHERRTEQGAELQQRHRRAVRMLRVGRQDALDAGGKNVHVKAPWKLVTMSNLDSVYIIHHLSSHRQDMICKIICCDAQRTPGADRSVNSR